MFAPPSILHINVLYCVLWNILEFVDTDHIPVFAKQLIQFKSVVRKGVSQTKDIT